MISENRSDINEYQVYWVIDNEGQRHLYHDRLAAQLAEIRFEIERNRQEND